MELGSGAAIHRGRGAIWCWDGFYCAQLCDVLVCSSWWGGSVMPGVLCLVLSESHCLQKQLPGEMESSGTTLAQLNLMITAVIRL